MFKFNDAARILGNPASRVKGYMSALISALHGETGSMETKGRTPTYWLEY